MVDIFKGNAKGGRKRLGIIYWRKREWLCV